MRRIIIYIVSISVFAFVLSGCRILEPKQYADYSERSGFVVQNIDSVNVDNLVVLAKVWGFAKYHHPVFADSIYNIDYELFELLPRVAYASKDECNSILYNWVTALGPFKSAEKKYRKEIKDKDYVLSADIGWICDTELLGKELSAMLQNLRYARRTKPSRYAQTIYGYYINFSAESVSGTYFSNDTGYNLLTLFRLWNMAEYYFPSVNITDKKWADVLIEYVPEFLHTENIYLSTAELITELCDAHATMRKNPIFSNSWLPVDLKFVDNKLIVVENRKYLADGEKSLFELGDEILSIDGHSPQYFIERAHQYIAASNESGLLHNACWLASFVSEQTVNVIIKRDGQRKEINAPSIYLPDYYKKLNQWDNGKSSYELLNDSIGYLYAGKYKRDHREEIMTMFADTKAIIVDFRCYPSGFMPFEFVGEYFVPNVVQHVLWTKSIVYLPGYFRKDPTSLGYKNDNYYKGQVVVLVNEFTQSSAEYQTMAFQACPNAIVVGSQTAGADGNVVHMPLPRGIISRFSGLGVYYPDGTNTQRTGIRIDHYVEPTIEGIKEGRDEVLEKALEIINSGK